MDINDRPTADIKPCGWTWGKKDLAGVLDLERELLSPITFPLPELRWAGQIVANSDGLEAWMVQRGFYGLSLRDAGYVWARSADRPGAPVVNLRTLDRSDVDSLWREMSELAAGIEIGQLGLAAKLGHSPAGGKPRV